MIPPTGRTPPPGFVVFAAASPIHDEAVLRELIESYLSPLRALGGRAWDPASGPAPAPPVVFVATGGTERPILESLARDPRAAAVLVAHPGHNSLPAALEVLARLRQLGARGTIHYLRGPGDADGWRELAEAIHGRQVREALRESRIGLVGEPADWLVASRPALELVRSVWGPTVVPLPLEPLLGVGDGDAEGERVARDFQTGATPPVEASADALLAAGGVHARLCRLVQAERLDAVAVRCFDLVVRRRTTGCLALARLNEDGIVAGCEGDLVATVAMLWLRLATGAIPWMANPSRVDPERGLLSLAHCTVARGLTTSYRLRTHFESGQGVGIQGTLPTGPVTLVRIGGARLERLLAIDGQLVRNTDHADLCRTQVEVEIGGEALRSLLTDPLGNHLVLTPGHAAAALRRWHEAMIG